MNKIVTYNHGEYLETDRDAIKSRFLFSVIDSNLIGKPEEKSATESISVIAFISGTLHSMWTYRDPSLDPLKILFEFAKRHILEKIKEGTILQKEEIWLTTNTQPKESPLETNKIRMISGDQFEIEIPRNPIMENYTFMQIATDIIETRDYINGIASENLGARLLTLVSERDLLQLFREANTEEEFVYRMSALKNIATSFNEDLLKTLNQSSTTGSINLLEGFLRQIDEFDEDTIKVLRSINKLRQSYPIHTDTAKGLQDAHKYFNLSYPIKEYNLAWQTILLKYLEAIKGIFTLIGKIKK